MLSIIKIVKRQKVIAGFLLTLNCSYSTSVGEVWWPKEQRNYISFRNLDASRSSQKKKSWKYEAKSSISLLISCWNPALLLTSSRTTQRTWANTRPKLFLTAFWKYWPPFAVRHAEGFKFKHLLSKLASFYCSCKSQPTSLPWWRWLPLCKPPQDVKSV